jgi:hypothetical protein
MIILMAVFIDVFVVSEELFLSGGIRFSLNQLRLLIDVEVGRDKERSLPRVGWSKSGDRDD